MRFTNPEEPVHYIARHRIPYERGFPPATAIPASGESKGTILFHLADATMVGMSMWGGSACGRERSSRDWSGLSPQVTPSTRCTGYEQIPQKALDALDFSLALNDRNMHPERVTQDVLILSGGKDHFISFKMQDADPGALQRVLCDGAGVHKSKECRESLPDGERRSGTRWDD